VDELMSATSNKLLKMLWTMCFVRLLITSSYLVGQELSAYEVPLSPVSVHDAYVLGQRNDHATAEFVAPYVKQITATGADGPRRADIQILTPYSQIVDESRRNATGYNEDQATKNYQRRGNIVTVSMVLIFLAAYPKQHEKSSPATKPCEVPALQPENFWRNFKFAVKQRESVGITLHQKRAHLLEPNRRCGIGVGWSNGMA
jgi:hypothetical protein